jgi:hypothetical protein
MTSDTLLWILVVAALVQFGFTVMTYRLAQQAFRATPRGSGQHLIDFPHDKWGRSYQEASEGLQQLAAIGEAQGG